MTPLKAPFLGNRFEKKPKKSENNKTDETKIRPVNQNSLKKLKKFFEDGGPGQNYIDKQDNEAKYRRGILKKLREGDKNKKNDSNDRLVA